MKGLTIADTIGIFAVVLMIFVFFSQVMPKILNIIVEVFSKTSSQAVSRQLAAYITVSGASTHRIEIKYIPSKEITYNIHGDARFAKVSFASEYYGEKTSASAPYATPPDNFGPFNDVNTFFVSKTFRTGGSTYAVTAKKE